VHDAVLAEGLACETFLDTGNRGAFANGGGPVAPYPDFSARMWEAMGCAPLAVHGARLEFGSRRRLRDRAPRPGVMGMRPADTVLA